MENTFFKYGIISLILFFMAGYATALPFNPIDDITEPIRDFLLDWLSDLLYEVVEDLMDMIVDMISFNPDISLVYGLWSEVKNIINGFFVIVFIIAGISLLIGSIMGSSPGRLLNIWFVRTLASIIAVNASFTIFSLILDIEGALTREVFATAQVSGFIGAGTAAILFLFIDFFLAVGVILVFIARHILVLILAVVFPVILFLWLLPPTKMIGSALLSLTFIIVFLPFAEAICLRVSMLAFSSMESSFSSLVFNSVFGIGAMGVMILIPFLLLRIGLSAGASMHTVIQSTRYELHTIVDRLQSKPKERQTNLGEYR